MLTSQDPIVLSRYFYDNVKFVSNKSLKCYEENDEVKIISINLNFLKLINKKLYDYLFEESFLGFTEKETKKSIKSFDNITKILNKRKKLIEKLEIECERKKEKVDKNNAIKDTLPIKKFKKEETYETTFKETNEDNYKNKNLSKQNVGLKIYQKVFLGNLKNINQKKNRWKVCYKNLDNKSTESKYFVNNDLQWEESTDDYINNVNNNVMKIEKNQKCFNSYDKISDNFNDNACDTKITKLKLEEPGDVNSNVQVENKDISKTTNSDVIPQKYQTQFISKFLVSNLEIQYFQKRKLEDINTGSWVPPKSPHNLIEESLYKDPWALLVATIFLNKTSCAVARPYVFWFLNENPDPHTVLHKFPSDLEKYFVNLGLGKTRATSVYRMSYDFLFKQWKSVRELFGIGDYGECAYKMFCLGDFSVEPKDRFLKIYKAWHQRHHLTTGY